MAEHAADGRGNAKIAAFAEEWKKLKELEKEYGEQFPIILKYLMTSRLREAERLCRDTNPAFAGKVRAILEKVSDIVEERGWSW